MRYKTYLHAVRIERSRDAFTWCYDQYGPCALINDCSIWDIDYFFDRNSEKHYNTYYFQTKEAYVEFVLLWT